MPPDPSCPRHAGVTSREHPHSPASGEWAGSCQELGAEGGTALPQRMAPAGGHRTRAGAQRWHRCGDPWGHGAGRAPCQPAPPASARSICDIRRCSSDRECFEAAPNAFLIPAYRRSLSELLSQPLCSALTATAQLQSRGFAWKTSPHPPAPPRGKLPPRQLPAWPSLTPWISWHWLG